MNPRFLTIDEVLYLHREQITQYGGSSGLRDRGLLESAISQPSAAFGGDFLHAFPFEMAAAYVFHLAKNHPFVDGNKRIATACGLVFLHINGWHLKTEPNLLADVILEVASGLRDKAALATWIAQQCEPATG